MGRNVEANRAKQRTTAVQRAFSLLEMVVAESRPMSLAQMAEQLNLPKPTVHRLASRLEADDLLAREPAGRQYTVGPRLNALAIGTLQAAMQRMPRHAILEALARETGETCNLAVLDGTAVVYLDRVETHWPLRLQLSAGSRVPLHCTASGKLFLSRMPKRARERLYAAAPFERFTDNTIVDAERLETELEAIRASGVAVNNQEFMVGLVGIAVPVPDPTQPENVVAALAIHAPEARLNATDIQRHLPALRAAATRLSVTLGEPA